MKSVVCTFGSIYNKSPSSIIQHKHHGGTRCRCQDDTASQANEWRVAGSQHDSHLVKCCILPYFYRILILNFVSNIVSRLLKFPNEYYGNHLLNLIGTNIYLRLESSSKLKWLFLDLGFTDRFGSRRQLQRV